MVEITFRKGDYGYEYFKMINHADDPRICAAVTGLGMALVGTLNNFPNISFNNLFHSDAFIEVEINPFSEPKRRALCDAVFTTVFVGLKQIALSYPGALLLDDGEKSQGFKM